MKRVLAPMGVEPGRLKLVWASAAEGAIFAKEVNQFVEEVRKLGPLNWNKEVGGAVAEPIKEEVAA
jgi:coenzyme F420-reducing hydrogenase delta subunit